MRFEYSGGWDTCESLQIHIHGKARLLAITSPDHPGMTVFGHSLEEALAETAHAIQQFRRLSEHRRAK